SAFFIGRMRFEEPHVVAQSHEPLGIRQTIRLLANGSRYIWRNRIVRSTGFVKGGIFTIGAGWVLFTGMGRTEVGPALDGFVPARAAFLGVSLLLGARGLGALIGPIALASWAGANRRRLVVGIIAGLLITGVGYALLGVSQGIGATCIVIACSYFGS